MTNLLQYKTNLRKSCRQPQCTLQLLWEDCVFFVWVDLKISFMQTTASRMWASNSWSKLR